MIGAPRLFVSQALAITLIVLAFGLPAAQAASKSHGLSVFGDLKYPADFQNFDYVNAQAPKGGRMVLQGEGARTTFNSFNGYILTGDAAQGLEVLFDSLMVRSLDEPDAVYGLAAQTAEIADDRKSAIFHLRPEARFADGSALTAADVAFSVLTLKEKGQPSYGLLLRDVVKAEAVDPQTVRFEFQGENLRDLPLYVAQLPIFSKAYYEARPFDKSTLDKPLGSGPYEIGDYKQGSFVVFKRRKDYWAADLPVNRGRYNFDELRYEYFRDRTAEFEALKGGTYDLREEFTAKTWETEYDIPQVREGRIKREVLPDGRPGGAQGWFLNTRRAKFADPRVREALNFAFDYEWSNKNLAYGIYTRTASYFENTDLKANGLPTPEELALLEPFRDQIPAQAFAEAYKPPVSDGSGQDRNNLRRAGQLLDEAGWTLIKQEVQDADCGWFCSTLRSVGLSSAPTRLVRRNAKGEILSIEFLYDGPTFERWLTPYQKNLELIGIEVTLRRIDAAQSEQRRKEFDYDVMLSRMVLPATPGLEMRSYLSSDAASANGSLNLAGVRSPAVDALIDKIMAAKSREELRVIARALDRVLRAAHYWVPNWYKAVHHLAYWDKFSKPENKPPFGRAVIDTWWFDEAKAARLSQLKGGARP